MRRSDSRAARGLAGIVMPELSTRQTIGAAIRVVWQAGPRRFVLIILATMVTSAAIAAQLLVGRALLDLIADNDRVDAAQLAPYLVALGVLLLAAAVSQSLANESRILLGEEATRDTISEVLDVAAEVDLEDYERSEFHDSLRRAYEAAAGQSSAVVFGIIAIVSTVIVVAGVVAVLLAVAPLLVPVAILGYLPIALVNVRNNRARYRLEHDLTELHREREYLEYLMTDRYEVREVRAYALTPTLRRWHARIWARRLEQVRGLVRHRLALTTLGTAVNAIVLVATLSVALVLAGRGSITIGDAAVAIVGLQQLNNRLGSAGSAVAGVHEGVMFLRDFERFRATLPDLRTRRPTRMPPSPPQSITVEGVGYRYPGAAEDALTSISFDIELGQMLALVGANGSGKSTLTNLLAGLLPPTHGSIRWDGIDIASCDPDAVRAQIGPVFQDYSEYLFTIGESIGLGDVTRLGDRDGIRAVADAVGLGDMIDAQDTGLDTRLGKMYTGGIDLSVGQWQRLAISRALFRDAPVVILDEPSASLDPRAELELFELLHSMRSDRIVILVSHRYATVRSADVIVVLDEGRVVETGSHDALMTTDGLYADLFRLQAERYGNVT